MKKLILIALIALSPGLFQACHTNNAGAADPAADDSNKIAGDTAGKGAATPNNDADAVFAKQAVIGGLAELALAKMALAKSGDTKIKDFADMMAVDHTRSNGELTNLVKSKTMQLPGALDEPHRQTADSLSKLSGSAFDKAYVRIMVDEHKKALTLMQNEAQNGKDADLKAFAGKTAQIVQTHLDSLTKIQAGMK